MQWKRLGKRLLFPPVWVLLLLLVVSTASLVLVLANGLETAPFAYVCYVVAFYTLTAACLFLSVALPKRYGAFKQKVYGHPLGYRYMTDAVFRTHVALYTALAINLLYAGVNVLSFILYRSAWFVILAVYYSILAVMRFLLLRYARRVGIGRERRGELRSTVLCSAVLLTVNVVLSGAVLMMLYQNRGFQYHGILIYVVAAYTFYMTVHAVVDLVRYRRYDSPVMTMTKVIALSAALVSMLSLETAMLSQFGQAMDPADRRLMIALTGAGVSLVVVALSVYMIVRALRDIKRLKENL